MGMEIPAHLERFWSVPRLATLGTVRADGSAHLVPVKCMRVDDAFAVLTRPSTVKVRNVRATGGASLAEHTDTLWATVEGEAEMRDDQPMLAAARTAYAARFGIPDTWGTCVLLVRPRRLLHGT